MKKKISRNSEGFTIIELMIVIAVIGILMGIAVPSIGENVRNYRLSKGVRDLQSAVQSARIAAIKRNRKVCMAFDFATNKYTIFVDDGINDMSLDAGEQILKEQTMPSGIDFYATDSGNPAIQFNSQGMLQSSDRLKLQSANGQYRAVAVGITGNSRIVKSGNGVDWL